MAAKLRKGDKVVVLAGKDKGKEGTIASVDPKAGKAVVEGINMAIRHTRQSPDNQGGRLPKALPIELSNIALSRRKRQTDPRWLPHGRRQEGAFRQDHGGRDRCLMLQPTARV